MQTTGILSETAGEEVRSNVAKSLGWDCRCNAFWCLDSVRQNLELEASQDFVFVDVTDGDVVPLGALSQFKDGASIGLPLLENRLFRL